MKEKSIPESGGLQRGTWMAEIQVQVPATSRHAKKCALSRVRIVAAKTGCKRDRLLKERSACWPVEPESHGFFFRLDSPLSRSGPPAPLRRNDTPKFGTGTGNRTEDRSKRHGCWDRRSRGTDSEGFGNPTIVYATDNEMSS